MVITMGNDEFILYIRKWHAGCKKQNDIIGKKIWIWLRENDPEAVKIEEDQPCLWGSDAENVSDIMLPKTATQFKFNRKFLPELYSYIDSIGE